MKLCGFKYRIFISNAYVTLICELEHGHEGAHWDDTFKMEFTIAD